MCRHCPTMGDATLGQVILNFMRLGAPEASRSYQASKQGRKQPSSVISMSILTCWFCLQFLLWLSSGWTITFRSKINSFLSKLVMVKCFITSTNANQVGSLFELYKIKVIVDKIMVARICVKMV